MSDLPIELWHLIFDRLQLIDLSSCAQVSKTIYLAVKEYRLREIAFTGRVYEWFHYATPTTNHKRRVDFTMASILRRSSFNFDYLKRLKIGRRSDIDLNDINKFTRLEELDIDLKNFENKKSRTLSLANLKVLYLFVPIRYKPNRIPYVKLDTPRLAMVCTLSLRRLEFIFPESVRCIHTFRHVGNLSMFRNLEYLTLTDCYNQLDYWCSLNFNEFSVTAMKKLKEVGFDYEFGYLEENMSIFKSGIANLLGRPDLKVFWQNVQVTEPNLLTEYERTMKNGSLLAFQLKHYEKLKEKVHFFRSFDFNGSMKKLSTAGLNPRSEGFKSKLFANVSFRRIEVWNHIEERELLLELIARSPDLFALTFSNSGLDQSFFDQMADTVQMNAIPLRQLQFKGSSNGVRNFEFLLGLRELERFETNQRIPDELVRKLFELPMLTKIGFSSGGIAKRIARLSTNRFRLDGEPLSLQEFLEHFHDKPQSDASKCRLM